MNEKIRSEHRERTAFVYVRQSSDHQVREHREGQKRQYALADYARQLKFRKVTVIDDDLGRSGSGLQDRPGFARLLTAVCEGEAGAVLALEASRLARNNRDWHHLIDLCAITETLIIDEDGVYDPRNSMIDCCWGSRAVWRNLNWDYCGNVPEPPMNRKFAGVISFGNLPWVS